MFRKVFVQAACVLMLWSTALAAPKNIVVIGWDGAQRNHVKEMIERNELPNLVALCKQGNMVDIDVTDGATDTKAGWAQIFTGYSAEVTGVYSNGVYQPIPEGYTLFERLEKQFGPDNIDTVAIVGKKGNIDADAPKKIPYEQFLKREEKAKQVDQQSPGKGSVLKGYKVIEENGKKFAAQPGKPWYLAKEHMDLFVNGLVENEKVGEMALEELQNRKDKHFCFFIHFADPDHSGHKYGENSQEYTDAIKDDDVWTGRIIDKLKDLKVYENTLVYVAVDHGFDEGAKGHKYAPYVFLGTNDKQVTRDGDRMDIAPTIMKHAGLDLSTINPPLSGVPLDVKAPRKIAPAEKPEGFPLKTVKDGTKADAQDQAATEKPKKKTQKKNQNLTEQPKKNAQKKNQNQNEPPKKNAQKAKAKKQNNETNADE